MGTYVMSVWYKLLNANSTSTIKTFVYYQTHYALKLFRTHDWPPECMSNTDSPKVKISGP